MAIVLLSVFIGLHVFLVRKWYNSDNNLKVLSAVFFNTFLKVFILIILALSIVGVYSIFKANFFYKDIEYYEKLNYTIESEIDEIISIPVEKDEDVISYATALVEQSEELSTLLNRYNENLESINKIQELKESIPRIKWLLYFGK